MWLRDENRRQKLFNPNLPPYPLVHVGLQSQQDVDDHVRTYGGKRIIEGSFKIVDGNPKFHTTANLQRIFGRVTTVMGDWRVMGSSYVNDLTWMSNIQCVTDDMHVSYNEALTTLRGISPILEVGNVFSILHNVNLVGMGALGSVELYVDGAVYVKPTA